jgi:putative ABC transport system permease protein
MQTLWQDLRYGARMLMKQPGFTLLAVLTLSLGIGATTSIFSFVNGVLLRPLPFPEPERLVQVGEWNPAKGQRANIVSPRNLEDWERRSQSIEHFGAWRDWRFQVTTPEGPALVSSGIASPGLFTAIGLPPALGRTFLSEENQRGRDHVVVLSHRYWQTQFGGLAQVLGQTLLLDKEPFVIVGVLAPEFEALGMSVDVWAPLSVDPDQFLERHVRNRRVYARLKPGVTLAQAQAELETHAQQLAAEYPQANAGWTIRLKPLLEEQVGGVRPALLVLLWAVGCLLLIACANVAGLLLVRAAARRKEFAVRAALGAGGWRLTRQLLSESLLLAVLGGAGGALLTSWLVALFKAHGKGLPRLDEVGLNGRVFAFTCGLTLLTGVLFGLAPGLQAARINLVTALKANPSGEARGAGSLLRGWLVVAQLALACVLLVGAGLLGRSFLRLVTLEPGFNPQNLLLVQLFPPDEKYKRREQVIEFYQRVTAEFNAIPGVQAVGASSSGPQFGGYEPVELLAEGQAAPPAGEYPQARYQNIGPGYFGALQIPVLQGREFDQHDDASAPRRAIINETLARRFWPQGNPLGQRLLLVREKESVEVIGVVADTRRFGIVETVEPEIYWPYMQEPRWASYFILRTHGDPLALAATVRSRVAGLDRDVVVTRVRTMEQLIAATFARPRFNLLLLGLFAATALLLAAVGLYGVIAYSTAQRTHEIGIRMALGAGRRQVLGLVLGHGLKVALLGVALGLAASFWLTRLLTSMLYNVTATDPLIFILAPLALVLVALLACWLPARRATKVDPLLALRCD